MNIEWTVTVPDGYEAVATDGTLEAKPIERPVPAPLVVAGTLYELGGGYAAAPHRVAGVRRTAEATFASSASAAPDIRTGRT